MPITPQLPGFAIPPIPSLPSPSPAFSARTGAGRRASSNTSFTFSFAPGLLVDTLSAASAISGPSGRSPSVRRPPAALDPNRSVLGHSPRGARGPKSARHRRVHQLAQESSSAFSPVDASTSAAHDSMQDVSADQSGYDATDAYEDEGEDDEEFEWDAVDRMRLWRHDALMQHLYETAAFWGDKVVSWTHDPNDAFWLAQTFFLMNQHARAERLLTRPFPTNPTRVRTRATENGDADMTGPGDGTAGEGTTVNGHGAGPSKGVAMHLSFGVPSAPSVPAGASAGGGDVGVSLLPAGAFARLPVGPGAQVDVAAEGIESVSRLVDMSVACRYLCAQCLARMGRWRDALEMLGEANPFKTSGKSGPNVRNTDGGIKIESSMCNLRGQLMLRTNRPEQAKLCFMEALALDVRCFDAFDALVAGEMLTPEEEWQFVQGLAYAAQTPDDATFVRLAYVSRLRKHAHGAEHEAARTALVREYGLADNADVLWAFADALYAQFRWADCFKLTERILGLTAVHTPTMPLHIACMYHLRHLHSRLFILAHELVEAEPDAPIAWYAVGVWYLAQNKWADARTYFSKTSLMDPRFAPSWVAYAHTFSFEKEHEQAIVAYSSCARSYAGSHLPLMFVGMENIMLSQHAQADEALKAASMICPSDPLLVNERGVMRYNHGDYAAAAILFEEAIALAQIAQGSQSVWATTFMNLGTSYRKLRRLDEAKRAYKRVLEIHPLHPTGLAFLGMTCHLRDELDDAILHYHEALSVDPINHHVLELLNLALEANADAGLERLKADTAARTAAAAAKKAREAGKPAKPSPGKGKGRSRKKTSDDAMNVG